MGCTPSHSIPADQNAEHGNKLLKKGILPADPEREGASVHLLIKGSSSYNIDDLGQEMTWGKDHFLENTSDEDKNADFHSSSEDPSFPEVQQEEKDIDRLVSETGIAVSELTESYQYVPETMKRKQNSCKSQKNALESKHEKQTPKRGKKQKNSRKGNQDRHCKTKDKSCAAICKVEEKVDFPDLLVKAHQNTYAYLNPNLSKYEIILRVAHQAIETQLILQQMVSFLLLRFDEINHLLEETAKDGEDLLKEVDGNLSWPADKENPKEQPDLLQQLLQYTLNKMQLVNGTVASLTSEVLQESCSFLQSAGSSLEEKLKAKQGFDERLLRTIKLLETSIAESYHPYPDDRTLYSEDSGIGIDTESFRDLHFLDKQGVHASCDSCSLHQSLNETIGKRTASARKQQGACTSLYATTGTHDCAVENHFKDIFYPPAHSKDVTSSEIVTGSIDTVLQHQNIGIRIPLNSVHSADVHEDESEECESTEASSTSEDNDDNSASEEESDSMLEKGKEVLPKRPTTVPASKDIKLRCSTKWMESPEKEEIILKMKDAISEKIKFVPAKTEKREWSEDENGRATQVQRPSTATRSQKAKVKQRRSRSAESLKNQAEDPTLLELQRTQKVLSKNLEMFYTHNENKETKCELTSMNQREQSKLQDYVHATHRSAINKLKASLAQNFSILPNQDKVPLLRQDQNAISKKPDGRKCGKLVSAAMFSQEQMSSKENEPPGTQKVNSVICAPPRKSVKKLIETFSPAEGLVKPINLRTLGSTKCIQKFGLPGITSSLPTPRWLIPLNQKHRISPVGDLNCPVNLNQCAFDPTAEPVLPSRNDKNEEIDEDYIENLPPPPPEMLADLSTDSTESAEDTRTENSYSEIANKLAKMTEDCTTKKISHRMKASLFFINLLPSKNLSSPNFIANNTSKSTVDSKPRKCSLELNSIHTSETPLASHKDYEMKEAADLYRQNHKIIPLQHSKEISEQNESGPGNKEFKAPLALDRKQGSSDSVGKRLQNNLDSRDEQQPASPKIVSNAHSIFCPATSLFEAKPLLPPTSPTTDTILRGHPETSAQRNNTEPKQYGEQQKRTGLSVARPQSFLRRSLSDHKRGFPLPLPLFTSAASEPLLNQARICKVD
ncbi:UNVERIFIED_CONTAM: hypothetical protein K2H54_055288 [Gekko kuhli]